jgi:hypothetical protein
VLRLFAHGNAARLELAAQLVQLDVGELIRAREAAELALLDLAALLDFLEEGVRVGDQCCVLSVCRRLRRSKRSTREPLACGRASPV